MDDFFWISLSEKEITITTLVRWTVWPKRLLKVGWSRKQILKSSFEPKTKQKYFFISALASKMVQIKKVMAHHHAN